MPLASPLARVAGRWPADDLTHVPFAARRAVLVSAVLVAMAACSSTTEDATTNTTTETATPTATVPSVSTVTSSTVTSSTVTTSTGATGGPSTTTGVQPQGFTTVEAVITSADGEECEVCVWLADESLEYRQGLMDVTDLGEPVGMVFAYANDTSGNFFMFDTPTPLSIAWFGRDGSFLAATDMDPCLVVDSATCPRFSPDGPYAFALEVPQGDLEGLGVGPGSTLELVPGSESPLGSPCSMT